MIRRKRASLFTYINYMFFIVLGMIMLYPLWYVAMSSLSDPNTSSLNSFYLLPEDFTISTYVYVLKQPFIYTGYKNTLIVTLAGTLIGLAITIMVAYPLSRNQLKGRKFFFGFIMFTMIFNGGIIPTYIVLKGLTLIDKLWALILPSAVNVYFTLIMLKFFKNISQDLIESAKIDGCNDIYILVRIVLPLSKAVIATIALFFAVARWNEYLPGIIYINDREKKVLQVILNSMLREESLAGQSGMLSETVTPQSLKMAAVMISVIPILAFYPYLQKYFVKGIMLGAVKG